MRRPFSAMHRYSYIIVYKKTFTFVQFFGWVVKEFLKNGGLTRSKWPADEGVTDLRSEWGKVWTEWGKMLICIVVLQYNNNNTTVFTLWNKAFLTASFADFWWCASLVCPTCSRSSLGSTYQQPTTSGVSYRVVARHVTLNRCYWKCNFPMTPHVRLLVGWLVGRSVGRSVCHNFLKGREVTLPCSYRSTCCI